jgi:hypothetical protein
LVVAGISSSHSWPWTSCAGRGATANRRRRIGGLSVDKGTADAEPACPARFWQRPAFGKANKVVRYDLTGLREEAAGRRGVASAGMPAGSSGRPCRSDVPHAPSSPAGLPAHVQPNASWL